jgi:hypothetical protein
MNVLPQLSITSAVSWHNGKTHSFTSYSRLYDSTTNSWPSTSAGHMNNVRSGHTATLLHNGQVLIAGGFDIISNVVTYLASAELYTP